MDNDTSYRAYVFNNHSVKSKLFYLLYETTTYCTTMNIFLSTVSHNLKNAWIIVMLFQAINRIPLSLHAIVYIYNLLRTVNCLNKLYFILLFISTCSWSLDWIHNLYYMNRAWGNQKILLHILSKYTTIIKKKFDHSSLMIIASHTLSRKNPQHI